MARYSGKMATKGQLKRKWYAVRWERSKRGSKRILILMHRQILGLTPGRIPLVDHRNGNSLDNCRSNIRTCNYSQNLSNAYRNGSNAGAKGIYFDFFVISKPWKVTINTDNRQIHIGRFSSLEAAKDAYNEAAIKYHGEFAKIIT
jgi:hypothetical protein